MVDTKEDSLKSYVEFENEKMQHLVRLTKYFMGIVDIEYSTLKATEFVQFKNYLRLNKYKLEGTKVEKDEVSTITTMYSKGKYAFWLYSFSRKAKSGDNSTFNWYRIQISIYP